MMFYVETDFQDTVLGKIPKDWHLQMTKELGEVVTGITPSTFVREYWEGEYPFVTPTDMTDNKYVDRTERKVTGKGLETGRLIPRDSVLVTCIASIGKMALAYENCLTNQQINSVICRKEVNPQYVYYALGFRANTLKNWAGRTTNPIIKKSLFEKFPISIPMSELEQQSIAEILGVVDSAIQLVDRVVLKTERLKKGLMQELLTKGIGHTEYKQTPIGTTPKTWNIVKLHQVATVRYGLGQPPELDNNGVPMIRATNIKRGSIIETGLLRIKRSAIPNSRDPFLRAGDIIVVRSGAYTGDVGLITNKWEGAIAGYDLVVSPSSNIDSAFLAHYLLSTKAQTYFSQLKSRSAQPHLNSQQVSETPIPLPLLSEQQHVASILSTIEKELELERTAKKRLEHVKRGLMDLLLTGKIRIKVD